MSEKQKQCPFCGNLRPEEKERCPICGKGWNGRPCPGCGQYIPEEDTVCPHCGFNMQDARGGSQSKHRQLWMVFLAVMLFVLVVGGFVLIRHNHAVLAPQEMLTSDPVARMEETTVPDESSETEISDTETSGTESSGTELSGSEAAAGAENPYEHMLSEGSYTEVLEAILGLDTANLSAEEQEALADMLSKAVNGQYAQFEEHISSLQSAGNYDDALAVVDEEAGLYNKLIENPLAQQYVEISWPLAEKRVEIMRAHVNDLMERGQGESVQLWNEADLNRNILDRLQGYVDEGILTQDAYDRKRATIYGMFVNGKIASMGSEGADAADILAYIVDKAGDTGYNCQVLEYWDYYMSVIGKGAGNPTLVHAESADGYLLPGSASKMLGVSDVSGFSRDELRLAIYEIFARHGYVFQDQAVNTYFRNCSWYHIDSSFKEENLNEYERANLATLVNCMFDRYL